MQQLENLSERISTIWKKKWPTTWEHNGCYLHLEVSELIEATRGKGNTLEESSDVMFVFLGLLKLNNIPLEGVLEKLELLVQEFEND